MEFVDGAFVLGLGKSACSLANAAVKQALARAALREAAVTAESAYDALVAYRAAARSAKEAAAMVAESEAELAGELVGSPNFYEASRALAEAKAYWAQQAKNAAELEAQYRAAAARAG